MFTDLLLKRKQQRRRSHNCSRQLLPYVNTIPLKENSQERELSPWDSEENKINKKLIQMTAKSEVTKTNQRNVVKNDQNRLRQSKEYSPRVKKKETINKDLYDLIKMQKKGIDLLDFKQYNSQRLTKINRIQVKLTQSWENQHPQSRHGSPTPSENPTNRSFVSYYPKSVPVKVKIHKQLIENHRKNLEEFNNQKQLTIFYRTLNSVYTSKEMTKKRLESRTSSKNYKDKRVNNRNLLTGASNLKNVFQQNYMINPMCRGDIILHQVNKAKRKYKFRNGGTDPDSKTADNFLYKI